MELWLAFLSQKLQGSPHIAAPILRLTAYVFHIPYCWPKAINHFSCHVSSMLTLACMDTRVYEYTVFVSTVLFLVFPFLGILCSYGQVNLTVYSMCSWEGRRKAYSTCSAHLTVVMFYYSPLAYTFLWPKSIQSPVEDKVVAVFYSILTPVLNRVIYSLRNKEVLRALRRMSQHICSLKVYANICPRTQVHVDVVMYRH
ncbi:Olfactory receptor 2L8 [Heterocephalus glaber]|uniref:Olfactory receptor 2L8 n=1 Tax=Heterocephalus glaber TaxID=10181 RepID=G5B7Y5_HETGA|nr:Olfactory receptor 2L8 [Heterocephalus glaber]